MISHFNFVRNAMKNDVCFNKQTRINLQFLNGLIPGCRVLLNGRLFVHITYRIQLHIYFLSQRPLFSLWILYVKLIVQVFNSAVQYLKTFIKFYVLRTVGALI